jgi:ubiquinone/menaquinone biosynthesis C-methylase UbiE
MLLNEKKRRAIAFHSDHAHKFAARYSDLGVDPYTTCFGYSRYRLARVLERHLPERGDGRRLLDVGCGTGHHLASYRDRGFHVAGVDGSGAMIAEARANNPRTVVVHGDVETLPFAPESFDYVLCIEVLRYLPNCRPCLSEIRRVLKPGGICLATATPRLNLNGYWLVNRAAHFFGIPGLARVKQYFHTAGTLRRAVSAAGFGAVEVQGVYLGPVNWVDRLAPFCLPAFLRKWERIDAILANRRVFREFSNMFLVCASDGSVRT